MKKEIEEALATTRKWNDVVPLESVDMALVRAGAYVEWAEGEIRRLNKALTDAREELKENEGVLAVWRRRCEQAEAQRDEAIQDRHMMRLAKG